MIVVATKGGTVYQFGSSANEFADARMIITALTTGGYDSAHVAPGSRPALPVRLTSAEERSAIAALIPKTIE
jgi:hypothetical protein